MLGIMTAVRAAAGLFSSGAGALSTGLKSPRGRKVIGIVVAVLLLLGAIWLIMQTMTQMTAIKAERDNYKTMYENKDKEYQKLETKYQKVKKRTIKTERILPSGERIITTSTYEESETKITKTETGEEKVRFPPTLGQVAGRKRLPVSAFSVVSTKFWSVGAGYEAVTVKMPFLPYKIHGTLGIAVGKEWSPEEGKSGVVGVGVIVLQISKKLKPPRLGVTTPI
jgi:hypothetical protein